MCRYRSEVEQLRLNDFFADLDTLKDALAAKRTTTQKQRESDQAPMTASTKRNPDKMKHRATHGSHAYAADNVLSAETEDLLFSRPNAPSGMSLQLVVDLIKDCRQVGSPKLSLSLSLSRSRRTSPRTAARCVMVIAAPLSAYRAVQPSDATSSAIRAGTGRATTPDGRRSAVAVC